LRCLVAHLAECDSQYYAASGELVVAITNETIAETTGLDPWSVTRYRKRFREIGLFVALNDKGTGRPCSRAPHPSAGAQLIPV